MERTFREDLEEGKNLEKKIFKYLQRKYPRIEHITSYFKSFDLYDPETNISWEIKGDFESQNTKNIIIEVDMPPSMPSALKTTGATYWLIDTGIYLYQITPLLIWQCIAENSKEIEYRESMTGKGDTTPKNAYLIPILIFENYITQKIESSKLNP